MFATKQSTLYLKKFMLFRKMSFSYRKSVFVTLRLFAVKQMFNNKRRKGEPTPKIPSKNRVVPLKKGPKNKDFR